MKRAGLALLLAAIVTAAAAQESSITRLSDADLKTAAELRDKAMYGSEAYMVLESLTTEVGARMAGSPGDALAVAWAQAKFKELGFDKVYTEPVTYPVWQRRHESADIVSPYAHKLTLTALGASVGTGRKPLQAEVVEYATVDALKAARVEDVRGKIVFIGNRMTRAKDGAGYRPAVVARVQGSFVAADKGAVAILIRSIGTDANRLPHTGTAVSRDEALADPAKAATYRKTRSGVPIVSTPIPAAALSGPDADLLSRVLERSRPVVVRLDLDVGFVNEYTSANVIGELTGTEHPEQVVVLGAHLDSWDLGTGAIDDGAGVAITMAAAHLIGKNAARPRRTIRVVAFANEESGLYGGHAYADRHQGEVAQHVLGAESDFGAGRIYALSSAVKPEALGAIDGMMQVLSSIGVMRGTAQAFGGPDIGPMHNAGMAVVELSQDGTDYFDLHHTANDTLDKVEAAALNQNVAVYAVVAYLAAQAQGDFGSAPAATTAPGR